MSRRENASSGSNSPIVTYMRWHGDGHVEYYDKSRGENITLDSLDLVVLDIRSSVTGWSDSDQSKITSNMIKDISKEILIVKPFRGKEIASGVWKDIKDDVNDAGGKFTVNLIALDKATGDIVNLQLIASNLAEWMTFREKTTEKEIFDAVLSITAGERRKKGATKFTVPAFTLTKLDAKTDKLAEVAYETVKAYFSGLNPDSRVNSAAQEEVKTATTKNTRVTKKQEPEEEEEEEEEHDDLPF